jgi:hypothetical protein
MRRVLLKPEVLPLQCIQACLSLETKQIESVSETATVAWPSKRACRRKPRLRSVHNNSAPPERRPSAVAQPVCRKTLWPATASTDGLCGCLAFGKH